MPNMKKFFMLAQCQLSILKLTKCCPLIIEPLERERKTIYTHALPGQLKINFHAVLSVNNWNLFASEDLTI